MKYSAVIAAAGMSSRMNGEFKPLLPINGRPALINEIELFLENGVAPVIVVSGHRFDEVKAALSCYSEKEVILLFNERYKEDMFLSVQLGVSGLPEDTDAFFFLPSDCPAISGSTIAVLKTAMASGSEHDVLFPSINGKNGHPPIISAKIKNGITSYSGECGLKGFLSTCSSGTVEVTDEEILRDMDTPAEYDRLINSLSPENRE